MQATLSDSSSSKSDLSLEKSALSSLRSFVVPHLSASDQKKFNQYMAMHFYCTGTSFSRIEDPYLLCAVQLLQPGEKLPNRMQLANDSSGGLLQCCYQKVEAEVHKLLSVSNHVHHQRCMVQYFARADSQLYGSLPNKIAVLGSCSHWIPRTYCRMDR